VNKKQLIIAWVMGLLLLSGCTTADWNRAMYGNERDQVAQYGATCEFCNRNFTVDQSYSSQTVICPYCGKEQNLQYALNRYTYDLQQAQEQQRQANSQELLQKLSEDLRPQTHSYSNPGMDYLNYLRNRPATSYYTPPTQTRCHYDPMGNFICDTSGSGGPSTTRCHYDPSGNIVCDTSRY
jgi:hypothetical protein